MELMPTPIADCCVLVLDRYADSRGVLTELFRGSRYAGHGLPTAWTQINCSTSAKNVVRGIHIAPFAKLVACVQGRIFDVIVDVRPGSASYRRWVGEELSPTNGRQLYIPPGCGHAFMALEEQSTVVYAQTGEYNPAVERTINWRDPQLGITWPVADKYILSPRDRDSGGLDSLDR
jgi:dTDP-4-dehydrorhamnose 3,5-epimerase